MSLKRENRISGSLALLVWGLVLAGLRGYAQEKSPVTFGKVTAEDFVITPSVDTAADAIVISDVGIKTFEYRTYAPYWWEYLQHTKRILIRKKRGFEAATVTIPLEVYSDQSAEVTGLKAATYNLEGDRVVKRELDKNSIFKIRVSENWTAERFTFPALSEGSIIEYTYTETSPFVINDHSWQLQSIYPCLWSEYKVTVPSLFIYSVVKQSALPFCIETEESKQSTWGAGTSEGKTFHWAVKNVPAMKVEPFTTTVNNYLARVDVRISGYRTVISVFAHDPGTQRSGLVPVGITVGGVTFNWLQLDRQLLQSDHFGADLAANNSWLDKDMTDLLAGARDDLSRARRIYDNVRDNFVCNAHPGYLMTNTLKSVFKAKIGSTAELNLLLTAMLRHEKLRAFPVVLSTRSNGFINELLPQATQLNYVVCELQVAGESYFLDASDRNLGFGQLPLECYNGYDVAVDTTVNILGYALSADSVTEKKKIVVYLTNGDHGGLDGSVQSYPGIAEAAEIRKKMKEVGGEKKFREELAGGLTDGAISDLEIDSLKLPDEPLAISYSSHLAIDSTAERFYFTPTLVERMAVNPFKAAERTYPVEMPYARDMNYILTMDIPAGYVIDELPASEKLMFNDDGSYFEYVLTVDGDQIHFRTRTRLMHANYEPQAYDVLREFFAHIVKKENEQIVFSKKK
ncbi:MAG TPA: hypothetical protein VKR41_02615 [Puia sp.]|nr:hypothetical protein [Puia sp.]